MPASSYQVLYSFAGKTGGGEPTGLLSYKGALYGTTIAGGPKRLGTVFVRDASGKVTLLYSFAGGSDGATPQGTLVPFGGKLYGTTEYGGSGGDGTVYSVSPSGNERVVYSFKGGSDGSTPIFGALLVYDGALYGLTNAGGNSKCVVNGVVGCGTVFKVTPSGNESVIYRFRGKPDGANPSGGLIDVDAMLYGTTNFGGAHDDGSVFSITPSGTEQTLYSFKGYPDGVEPYAGLTVLNGTLYGTTALGGAFDDSGTVFSLAPSGTESVLHSFKGYPDGAVPITALMVQNGTLFGTTQFGGSSDRACLGHGVIGCGVIFSIAPSGSERILYKFKGEPDGSTPWAALIQTGGTFYGSTLSGGTSNAGSLFAIAPLGPRAR